MDLVTRYEKDRIQIWEPGGRKPLLVQNASPGRRPYIHPICAPADGGCLTETESWHHLWQHGLYTGLHGVSGWDFWTEGLSWRGLDGDGIIDPLPLEEPTVDGNTVAWEVRSRWMTRQKQDLLKETQRFGYQAFGDHVLLDMAWELEVIDDIAIAQCAYGGPFVRMPFRESCQSQMLNSEGDDIDSADSKRATWLAVAMLPPGKAGPAGIAILDHPSNANHPVSWRGDSQFGISPSSCILGEIAIAPGEIHKENYRLFIFAGSMDKSRIDSEWEKYKEVTVQ